MVVAPLLVTNRYSLDDFRTDLNNINFLEQSHRRWWLGGDNISNGI